MKTYTTLFSFFTVNRLLKKPLAFLLLVLSSSAIVAQADWMQQGPPVFHGAAVTGAFPNTDFLFAIPVTGERPILYYAENLPEGLKIDNRTGFITGQVAAAGDYSVRLKAVNKAGRNDRELQIKIGDKLCLTPPLGWNSWNVFTNTLNEKMVMDMADAMVSTGMRDLGYQYINMDDFWHDSTRAADGKPVANPEKFPHGIKWLADYVHSKGLKLGIYSDAGDKTCGKCFGSDGYEEIDAKTYAEWGVDLLKYDFCFVPWKKKEALERYQKMGTALKNSGRSIVYSICNWGLFNPWEWAAGLGGNYWRTTPDIIDTWGQNPIWFASVKSILKRQNKLSSFASPGHWNDPDMLIVGNYGQGKATGGGGKYKGMTDTEYQSHMSLWAMMASPLLASCDLRNMNPATQRILMNPELLAINQDSKGEQAQLILKTKGIWVYKKNLSDGSAAVAILNTTNKPKEFAISNAMLGLQGNYTLRDVWQHAPVGTLQQPTTFTIQSHQTIVLHLKQQR